MPKTGLTTKSRNNQNAFWSKNFDQNAFWSKNFDQNAFWLLRVWVVNFDQNAFWPKKIDQNAFWSKKNRPERVLVITRFGC